MGKYKVIIDLDSENSAKHLKEEIEKLFPLVEGRVRIVKEPEIQPLSEIIENQRG